MRVTQLFSLPLFAALSWACVSSTVETDAGRLGRLDGSYVSVSELEEHIPEVMSKAGVTGLQMSVINQGNLVYAHAWGLKSRRSGLAPDRDTVFRGLSFSKPTFAYLVMQLVEDGTLDLDRPLVDYLDKPLGDFEEWSDLDDDPRMREITAHRILTHTTGWPNYRALGGGHLDFTFPPGDRFSYSGEGFNFLQMIVEHVTGTPLDVLARERVFSPLKMERTSYVWESSFEANHADGHTERQEQIKMNRTADPSAAGSLVTTASDYARLLIAVMNGESLSQNRIDEMLSPVVPIRSTRMFGPLALETSEDNDAIHLAWGLGWGVFETGYGRAFFHTGHDVGWENYTVAYRDRKIGIVLLSNSNNFESIAQELVELVIGDHGSPFTWLGFEPFDPSVPPPPPAPQPEAVADPSIGDAVAGVYEVQPGDNIFLKIVDGRLVGSGDGSYWDDVLAQSETTFLIDGKPYTFTFTRDAEGNVTGLVIDYQGTQIPARKTK